MLSVRNIVAFTTAVVRPQLNMAEASGKHPRLPSAALSGCMLATLPMNKALDTHIETTP